MKTRNDFVSNSSSCSFIISANHSNYPFNKLVDDIVDDCVANADEDDANWIETTNDLNRRNLNYHLKSSELLYLGTLVVGEKTITAKRSDENHEMFDSLMISIKDPSFGKYTGEKIISASADEIVYSYNKTVSSLTVSKFDMERITGHYVFADEDEWKINEDEQKEAAKHIVEYANIANDASEKCLYSLSVRSSLFFISPSTIWNTKALLAAGYKISFDKWEDLEDLEKRLKNGESIYGICQNNGGDGMDEKTIYALGGWGAKFNTKNTFEVITSYC